MTWGIGDYGGDPWGGGVIGDLYVVGATLTSERTVELELSKPPRAVSSVADGDALNPLTWFVRTYDSTGAIDRVLLVLAVRQVSTTVFELYTLDKFSSHLILHRAGSTTLVDPTGFLIAAPTSADFLGSLAQVPLVVNRGLVDVANPQLGKDGSVGGTLVVGASGDYENESGEALYRKLVLRRLLTTPGDWFHYDPSYGVGIRLKEPFLANDLVKLKGDVERQLSLEPEFAAVQARITLGSDNVMIITVKVQIKSTNAILSIPIQVPNSLAQV